jgi:pimeloyl-ACP methyl ester carboxylesterase
MRVLSIVIRSITLAAAVALGVASAESDSPPSGTFIRPPPPGELVDIGGRRLHLLCKGSGPSVIIEGGLSNYTAWSTYTRAQEAIAPFAQACTYDRAGLGWSDPAPPGRTQQDMVEDLHRLIKAAKIKGPVVLVGHSMGGLLVRLYAKSYSREVAGLVLVDATTEAVFSPDGDKERKGYLGQIDGGLKDSRPGQPIVNLPAGTPPDVLMAYTPEILRAVRDEYLAVDRVPEAMRTAHGYGTLGDKPLAIVARGRMSEPPSEIDTSWRAEQQSEMSLSSNAIFIVAEKSGHVIPYDEPDVIADAVERVLDAVRSGGRLASKYVSPSPPLCGEKESEAQLTAALSPFRPAPPVACG